MEPGRSFGDANAPAEVSVGGVASGRQLTPLSGSSAPSSRKLRSLSLSVSEQGSLLEQQTASSAFQRSFRMKKPSEAAPQKVAFSAFQRVPKTDSETVPHKVALPTLRRSSETARQKMALPTFQRASFRLRAANADSEPARPAVSRSFKHDYRNPDSNYPDEIVGILRRSHGADEPGSAANLERHVDLHPFLSKDFLQTLQQYELLPSSSRQLASESEDADGPDGVHQRRRTRSDTSNTSDPPHSTGSTTSSETGDSVYSASVWHSHSLELSFQQPKHQNQNQNQSRNQHCINPKVAPNRQV